MPPHSNPIRGGKEVNVVEILVAFVVSVAAGVVSYYICKWLDQHSGGR